MLISLLAVAAPQVFVAAVDHRLAGTKLHVTDWWADDLDGDKVPEAIARVCDDVSGFFLVQRGADLFEVPLEIDGRNNCDAESRPAWTTRHDGSIGQNVNVHHGSITNEYAIRDGGLALIREASSGFDVNRDGSHDDEDDVTDYDKLTWTHTVSVGKSTRAGLVVATPHGLRVTTIVGKTTTTAVASSEHLTLHIHADRPLVVRVCSATPCTTTRVSKGDRDVVIDFDDLEVVVGGKTYPLHVVRLEAEQRFPSPPRPW